MKYRYDILIAWSGSTRRSQMCAHAARYLLGKQKHTQTACGKDLGDFGVVDHYPVTRWHLAPDNPLPWCETCRSMLIGRVDEMSFPPLSNTGVK